MDAKASVKKITTFGHKAQDVNESAVDFFRPPKPVGAYNNVPLYLKVELLNNKVYIYNSYNIKDTLKSYGFMFDGNKKAWYGDKQNFYAVANAIWDYLDQKTKYFAYSIGVKNNEVNDFVKYLESDRALSKVYAKRLDNLEDILNSIFTTVPLLRDYQKEAIRNIIEKFLLGNKGFILEDEQGLGKTLQACSVVYGLYSNGHVNNVLIMTTNNLTYSFQSEFVKFFSNTDILKHIENKPKPSSINILAYSRLTSKDYELIRSIDYDLVVLDEVHNIKNISSKRYKRLVPILERSKFILAMTGTLLKNRPLEAYNITKHIKMHSYSIYYFVKKFEGPNSTPNNYFASNGRRKYYEVILPEKVKELREFMKGTGLYMRRRKEDVLKELPPKHRIYHPINLSKEKNQDLIEAIQKEKEIMELLSKKVKLDSEVMSALPTYRRIIGLSKVNHIVEFLESFTSERRFIIFAHHNEVIERLYQEITSKYPEVSVELFYGKTNKKERERIITRFQSDSEDVIWLIGSLATMSEGMTLTKANFVLFAEIDWVPATMIQAEDRIHRISQTKKCIYYYIIALNTLDHYIYKVLETKNKYLGI